MLTSPGHTRFPDLSVAMVADFLDAPMPQPDAATQGR